MSQSQQKTVTYSKVVERASLNNILLTSCSFEMSADYHVEKENAERFIRQDVLGTDFEDELLIGWVRCRVWMNRGGDKAENNGKSPDEESSSSFFSIKATYLVGFKIPGEHDREIVDQFFDRLAPISVWPYFRAHVAQVASEAGVEVPILPIKKLFHDVKSASGYVDPDKRVLDELAKS